MHHGGRQRPRCHRVRSAVLGEPGQGQLLSRQAHEQALDWAVPFILRKLASVLRLVPSGRLRRGAVRLLALPVPGERFRNHAHRPFRVNLGSTLYEQSIILDTI